MNFKIAVTRVTFASICTLLFALQNLDGQTTGPRPCDSYLPDLRIVDKQRVGPESCLMQETDLNYQGRDYSRVDIGLNGSVEGYVTKQGDYGEYLTMVPELAFPQAQASDVQPHYLAIARYEMLRGAAILLIHPASSDAWNGKLWVTAHGRGRSFHNGRLKAWNHYLDPDNPLTRINKLERAMLSLGYAVAITRRTSEERIGEIIATLSDGSVVDWAAFNDSQSLIKDYAAVAEIAIQKRLGRTPNRTYLYGKSAGARLARGLNYYAQRLNLDTEGRPIFDGFLVDDSAAGTWLPVHMQDGRDTLLTTDGEKEAFVPQLEIVHQAYWNFNNRDVPDFVTHSFLANKYSNARTLMEKGLGDKLRVYEIRQISHDGGSNLPEGRDGKLQILDLSLLMEGAIKILDRWVEGTAKAPPSRSDYAAVGDTDRDGIIDQPALSYPEVACPLGRFYPYPRSGSGTTSWAAFTGKGVEPRDDQGVFVDMNENGLWDFRETPEQAWRRLGLLKQGETLTRSRYVSCVRKAAQKLADDGFFDPSIVDAYVKNAQTKNLSPASDDAHALIYYSRF